MSYVSVALYFILWGRHIEPAWQQQVLPKPMKLSNKITVKEKTPQTQHNRLLFAVLVVVDSRQNH